MPFNNSKLLRMAHWFVLSVLLYAVVLHGHWPLLLQAALTKGANVNAGAFLGYWVDRGLFASFDLKHDADPNSISDMAKAARVLARGLVVAACVIGLGLGVGA